MNITKILTHGMTNVHVVFANPNYGGCGLVAQSMYKVLSDLNVDVKVVLVESAWGGYEEKIAEAIESNDAVDASDYYIKEYAKHGDISGSRSCASHLGVVVDGVLYDSEGVLDRTIISDGISPEALALLLKSSCWNDWFAMANSSIQDIPSEMLKQVSSHFVE